MHINASLHTLLDSAIHKSRIKSLVQVIEAIINSKLLKLTQLGRAIDTGGQERSGIRKIDRILANQYYQEHSDDVYEQITRFAIGSQICPKILIDWTGLPNSIHTSEDGEQCCLRAALAAPGRSITIYEEVHPKKKEGHLKIHNDFLQRLSEKLPEGCKPIIITDAGFKNPWFKAVIALGWNYIGRVRGDTCYDEGMGFKNKIKELHKQATSTAKSLGEITIAKTNPFKTNVYLYKHKLKGRHKLTKAGARVKDKDSLKHAKGYKEPWVLVSSLSGSKLGAEKVVKLYKLRMSIEEGIRDTKSTEYGFSLNENVTIKSKRYIVWLMLSALASLIAWIVGYTAEKQNIHLQFQANTYKHKRVLSFFYLGVQVLRKKIKIPINFSDVPSEAWVIEYE